MQVDFPLPTQGSLQTSPGVKVMPIESVVIHWWSSSFWILFRLYVLYPPVHPRIWSSVWTVAMFILGVMQFRFRDRGFQVLQCRDLGCCHYRRTRNCRNPEDSAGLLLKFLPRKAWVQTNSLNPSVECLRRSGNSSLWKSWGKHFLVILHPDRTCPRRVEL